MQKTATTYLHINLLWLVRHIAEHRKHSQRRSLPHDVSKWLSIYLLHYNSPWCCSPLTDRKGNPLSEEKRLRDGCVFRLERLSIYWTRRTWKRWLSKLKANVLSKEIWWKHKWWFVLVSIALRLITSITATAKYVFWRTYSHQTPQDFPSLCFFFHKKLVISCFFQLKVALIC